jgi:hypothetical protein
MKSLTGPLAALLTFCFFTGAANAQAPRAMTIHEATDAFTAVSLLCMTALERGAKLSDLPEWRQLGFRPAAPEQRKAARVPDADTPAWAPPIGPLLVSEPPNRCDVIATRLPVGVAFDQTVGIFQQKWPGFTEVAVQVTDQPIRRQISRVADGARYTIDLQGAEANTPPFNNKVSLLLASVLKDSVTAAPATASANAPLAARRDVVLTALNQHPINRYLGVWPNIPADDLQNILHKSLGLTADREVLGVIDTSIAKNGSSGLYFYADGMVSVKPVGGSNYIAYDAIRGIKADKGTFVVKYGRAELQSGPNKDEVVAIVDAILAGTAELISGLK